MAAHFDPQEFFLLASRISRSATQESEYRTAIGRAYYACYLVATNQMFGLDGQHLTRKTLNRILRGKRNGGRHAAVKIAIGGNAAISPGQAKVYQDMFGQLQDLRIQADYYTSAQSASYFKKYGTSDWAGMSANALTLASQLLPTLRRLSTHSR